MLVVLDQVYSQLDKPGTSIRLMFYDFSSAFNTIQPHVLVDKLLAMNIHPTIILWVLDYLTNRPQFVMMKNKSHNTATCSVSLSDTLVTNTGAPQGTVLSPFLFTLYTADCRTTQGDCTLVKYADDAALTGRISGDDDSQYRHEVDNFVNWCDKNYLELNVGKTKEMVIDFRKNMVTPCPVEVNGTAVERVETYKYLGVFLDKKLRWRENTDAILKKAHTRLYCLRKLRSFNVSPQLLQTFYSSIISSVLTYGLTCWGGNMTKQDRNRLDKLIKKASGVVGKTQDSIGQTYHKRVMNKLSGILQDDTHPLRQTFDCRVIERSGRMRTPRSKTARYSDSFVPVAVGLFNSKRKG